MVGILVHDTLEFAVELACLGSIVGDDSYALVGITPQDKSRQAAGSSLALAMLRRHGNHQLLDTPQGKISEFFVISPVKRCWLEVRERFLGKG